MPTACERNRYRDLTRYDTRKSFGKRNDFQQTSKQVYGLLDEYQPRQLIKDKRSPLIENHQANQQRRFQSSYSAPLQTSKPQSIDDYKRQNKQSSNFGSSNNGVVPRKLTAKTQQSQPNHSLRRESDTKTQKHTATYQPLRTSRGVSEYEWAEMENWSQEKQRQFLKQWESHFQKKPVNSQTRNVERGDHLCWPGNILGKKYEHHLLCTNVYGDEIEVIEYTGPNFGLSASSQSSASKNPLAFAKIQTSNYTYETLVSKNAKIIKWPKELERYTVEETIVRAEIRGREEGTLYHALENNCEHFVTWCKCGLNTSLQVKPWYRTAWECTTATVKSGLQTAGKYFANEATPTLTKLAANVSDEIAGIISSPLSPIGFGVGAVIETGFALYNIHQDYKRMKGRIINKKEFRENTVKTSFKAAGRVAGGIGGSIIGSAFGPAGSVVGGLVGMGVGHLAGSVVAAVVNAAPKIATVVKKTVSTVGSYIKKGYKKVTGFFKSLFS